MKGIFTLLAFFCLSIFAEANSNKAVLSATFEKVMGGRSYDAANAALQLKDGSFLVAGRTSSFSSSSDGIVIKLDASGNEVWQKYYGDDETEEIYDIIETSDNHYVFAGHSDSYNYAPDMNDAWAVKLDANGEEVWNVVFGTEETIEEAKSIVETPDGGFLMVGTTIGVEDGSVSNVFIVKITKDGKEEWKKTYGGELNEQGTSVVATEDGYMILGNSETFGEGRWDMWVLKIDKEGNKVWDAAFGGKNNEMANKIIASKDGGFLLAGYSYSFAVASLDAWVVKISADGKKQWAQNFGGLSTDEAFGLAELGDGSIVMGGYTDVYEPNEDFENISKDAHNILVVKMKPNGEKLWESSIGGTSNQKAFDLISTSDGGFLTVGSTDAIAPNGVDIYITKLNSSGKK